MNWFVIVIGALMVLLSVPLLLGKGEMLIAGYNTASDEEKSKYDTKKLCRTVGVCLLGVSAMLFLLGVITWKYFPVVFLVIVILLVAVTLRYANVKCKK